eukprot:CAMPEP_0198271752 /NCGR_PEP_ID=MMETSP1447-20131203/50490_1 /TAXON_ID=420782 /ORGANISM="Chaetoceros dichaeta, Strain CCMP1751" /LENGTH=339 /DNA_ID=CAMNT_0043964519 /DNA_START=68 /DNA_END=1087 /DNA_ORIENTATION=+
MTSHVDNTPDGSGIGIHMDAPIVRAAKNSSRYTRGSYVSVLVSICLMRWAWLDIHFHDASIYFICEDAECTLTITPPKRATPLTLKIAREQLVDSMTLNVDVDGVPITPINTLSHHHHFVNKHRHHKDEVEEHESYALVLAQNGSSGMPKEDPLKIEEEKIERALDGIVEPDTIALMEKYGSAAMTDPNLMQEFIKQKHSSIVKKSLNTIQKMTKEKPNLDLPNLDALKNYADKNSMGEYVLIMRRYNIGHTKRRVATLVTRIKQYSKEHRNRITVREKRTARWQGILGIVFGMFSLLLALIGGQFSDPKPTLGGPGVTQRRRKAKVTKSKPQGYGQVK